MLYVLPVGVQCAQLLDFSSAVVLRKNPSGMRGVLMSTGPGTAPVLGYRGKKWGNGQGGDKNALWRRGRGLNKGMRPLKFVQAKTAH